MKLVQENRGTRPAPLHDLACMHQFLPLPSAFDPEFSLQEISQDSQLTYLTGAVSQECQCQIFKVDPGASGEIKTPTVTSQGIYMPELAKNVVTLDTYKSDIELKNRQLNSKFETIRKNQRVKYKLEAGTYKSDKKLNKRQTMCLFWQLAFQKTSPELWRWNDKAVRH